MGCFQWVVGEGLSVRNWPSEKEPLMLLGRGAHSRDGPVQTLRASARLEEERGGQWWGQEKGVLEKQQRARAEQCQPCRGAWILC